MMNRLIENNTSSISRLFYVNLTLALVVFYLCIDIEGIRLLPASAVAPDSQDIRAPLLQMGPLLKASSLLRSEMASLRKYRDFLRPFAAIENAAQFAVRASGDETLLARSAEPRNRCFELFGSPSNIDFDFVTLQSDPRSVSLQYLVEDIGNSLFIQSDVFSNDSANEKIQSCLEVAREFGEDVKAPEEWPDSFYFVDYLERSGAHELAAAIKSLRDQWDDVRNAFIKLDAVCKANSIKSCSANELQSRLDKTTLIIRDVPNVEVPTIRISFLPTEIPKTLLLAIAPVALTFGIFLFVFSWFRRDTLLLRLKRLDEESVQMVARHPVAPGLSMRWASADDRAENVVTMVIWGYVVLGEFSSLVAQFCVLWWEARSLTGGFGWIILTLSCLTLSSVAYLALWRNRLEAISALAAPEGPASGQETTASAGD